MNFMVSQILPNRASLLASALFIIGKSAKARKQGVITVNDAQNQISTGLQ
jgi:hypothetical protein